MRIYPETILSGWQHRIASGLWRQGGNNGKQLYILRSIGCRNNYNRVYRSNDLEQQKVKTKVICISGKAQHGKDTAANEIRRQLLEKGDCSVLIAHYADLVKYVCRMFLDWDGKKDEHGRHLLQMVGTDIIRTQRPNYWVDFIVDIISMLGNTWDYVLIPDCRFPNECEIMKGHFDTTTVRVIRYKGENSDEVFENDLTEEQRRHPSETSLDHYDFDSYLDNPGTQRGLEESVSKWIKENIYG